MKQIIKIGQWLCLLLPLVMLSCSDSDDKDSPSPSQQTIASGNDARPDWQAPNTPSSRP